MRDRVPAHGPEATAAPRARRTTPPVAAPAALLALQGRAGNAAVSRLLGKRAEAAPSRSVVDTPPAPAPFLPPAPEPRTAKMKPARAPKPSGPRKTAGKPPLPGKTAKSPPPGKTAPGKTAPVKTAKKLPGGGGGAGPPAPPVPVDPAADPAFAAVTAKAAAVAKAKKAHGPAAAKAAEAQGAAVAPANDAESQAKAAKADTMDAQQPGTFDKQAFIAAVEAAIKAKTPKNLEEADEFKGSGKAGEVKGEVAGLVGEGKEAQGKDITEATEAPPDASTAVEKPVTPMRPEPAGPAGAVAAAGAAPKPAPPEQLDLSAGKQQADQALAEADVTEEQLAESNEPEFTQALADKKEAAQHADTAPGEYRKAEKAQITQSKAGASTAAAAAVAGMHGERAGALAGLVGDKEKTKSKDEQKRAEVSAKVQGIFDATEADVRRILDGIDPKVEQAFDRGEAKARTSFEAYVGGRMAAYKRARYSGVGGGLAWASDKLFGMPDEVNRFYEAGRERYLQQMHQVISQVADIVGRGLTAAKQRIAKGRAEISSYVKSLPKELQKVGSDAASEIGDRFDQLSNSVDEKQNALVDTLATKYTEARQGLDARIEELQAANAGLVDKALGAITGVINTIRELTDMLTGVLARAAGVVGDIIKAPVRFLGNLIDGVKGGILRFKDNILEHLQKGLMGWLFGELAKGGVQMPETFDLKGIIKLITSIFGLTWRNIRNRLVRQIGEPAMAAIEKGVDVFRRLASEGVAGLWEMLLAKLGDVKEMILEKVKDFVVTRVITAGITWLIGLLNPAAAFIKACKLIYDIVMFFVRNGSRIMRFVNTVLDSVADIVRGNVGGVVAKIENVLGQMVPILIGFLASVIGLGGIGRKIRQIVKTLQRPVNRALDAIIKTGLKLAGPLIRGLKGIGHRVRRGIERGKAWATSKATAVRDRLRGGDDSPEGKARRQQAALAAGVAAANRFAGRPVAGRALRPLLSAIRVRYGADVVEAVPQGRRWGIHAVVSRMVDNSATPVHIQPARTREEELADLIREQQEDAADDVGMTDVAPREVNVLDLPEYQEGIASASSAFARLSNIEQSKNVAAAERGEQRLSGWSGGEMRLTDAVYRAGVDAGHETEPHTFDPEGAEGQYESSHSERKAAEETGATSVASSKPMCPLCQRWFAARARSHGVPYFVGDPTGVHVFLPDGRHIMAGQLSGAVTMAPRRSRRRR